MQPYSRTEDNTHCRKVAQSEDTEKTRFPTGTVPYDYQLPTRYHKSVSDPSKKQILMNSSVQLQVGGHCGKPAAPLEFLGPCGSAPFSMRRQLQQPPSGIIGRPPAGRMKWQAEKHQAVFSRVECRARQSCNTYLRITLSFCCGAMFNNSLRQRDAQLHGIELEELEAGRESHRKEFLWWFGSRNRRMGAKKRPRHPSSTMGRAMKIGEALEGGRETCRRQVQRSTRLQPQLEYSENDRVGGTGNQT